MPSGPSSVRIDSDMAITAALAVTYMTMLAGIVTIPIDPRFRSLNLAQAVAINAYEWRTALADRPPPAFREGAPPADQAMLVGLYGQLEDELDNAGFYHPPEKRPSMVRNLRAILARALLNEQEVRTLRGVITALSKGRGRVLAKLAAAKVEKDG